MAIVAAACTGDSPHERPTATPTAAVDPRGPSQSPADAKRDGVPPAVAQLSFDERTRVLPPEPTPIPAEEGVWTLTRTSAEGVHDYGEVLLLDQTRKKIVRAFPLPGYPPYHLVLTENAVYCARAGDGGLPNSHVCRIDRRTMELRVRVFWSDEGPDITERPPPAPRWAVTDGYLPVYEFDADDDAVWAKDWYEGNTWTKLDPVTLEIVDEKVARTT